MIRVLFNKKGGVGKSSLSCNLAAISAAKGLKTLLIDLDTQCNASSYLSKNDSQKPNFTMADFFDQTITFHIRKKPMIEFCHQSQWPNLHLIPSSPNLDQLETKLESRHKIYKLREGLQQLSDQFDRIYIDTAPALNFYSLSALIAAQRCLIPIDCDEFSRQALYSMMDHLMEIKEDHNPELEVEGIIANQYLSRAKVPNQIISELRQEGHNVLNQTISSSVKMRGSHQAHIPLINLAPNHKLTQELIELWTEIEA